MNFNLKPTATFPHCKQLSEQRHRFFSSLFKRLHTARASPNAPNSSSSQQGNAFLLPGATVATLLMLGVLHARRLYDDKKVEEARERGVEFDFHPDAKASFLRLLPLRPISRFWGFVTSVEYPVWLRPHVYRAWARAFHSNLEEAALPLDQYASLRDFFVRTLKEGTRPIDPDSQCLVSPVDGIVLRFGELKTGGMIEQVKGFSYSVSSLLGASSFVPKITGGNVPEEISEQESNYKESDKSWWKISLASPKSAEGPFLLCDIPETWRLSSIHSPASWNIHTRRHFSGRLFPVNERATRTIRNLYVENERVVLEGQWQEGYMAMAAVGATNIGSIQLFIEPELRTNRPKKKLLTSDPPDERAYGPEGVGLTLKKGDQVAAFNMGSTVVLVFQAPISKSVKDDSSEFRFCIDRGDRIRVGEALGRWRNSN